MEENKKFHFDKTKDFVISTFFLSIYKTFLGGQGNITNSRYSHHK